MYLRHLRVQHVKLLRDVEIDFVGADGQARMWTVFVGENRLCKTTLLQTIAAASCGSDRGTQLVSDVVASWPDLRAPERLKITAQFEFSSRRHHQRIYPGRSRGSGPKTPPQLLSQLELDPDKRVFDGASRYLNDEDPEADPLTDARRRSLGDWFVAGYGPSRRLRSAGSTGRQLDPPVDRLRSLFGEDLIGTGFMELLGEDLGRAFAKVLQSVFVEGGLLPHVTALELRGRGGIRSTRDLVEAQRFEMRVGAGDQRIRVPAVWLSQGYQTLIAWLADVVGQILIEAGGPVDAADMEGTVLVDEIDLHLHPTWQLRLVPALKRVFPRLQFIATTHSAMVLPALSADEVFLLEQDDEGSVTVRPATQSPALLTGSELFDAFFALRRLYPNPLGEKTHRYGMLATDPMRSSAEDETMRKLREELTAAGIEFDWEPVPREDV